MPYYVFLNFPSVIGKYLARAKTRRVVIATTIMKVNIDGVQNRNMILFTYG